MSAPQTKAPPVLIFVQRDDFVVRARFAREVANDAVGADVVLLPAQGQRNCRRPSGSGSVRDKTRT